MTARRAKDHRNANPDPQPAPDAAPAWPRVALTAAAIVVAVAVCEIALRIAAPAAFHVWPPGLTQTFRPDPAYLPGISGESHFQINSEGMRADEPGANDGDGILAVGGSTTEGLFLDNSEAWPRVLQDQLRASGRRVVVANVGKSGHRTRHHALQIDRLLPQHSRFRTVLLLTGFNDLQRALQGELIANEPIGPQDYANAFMVYPGRVAIAANAPFYERLELVAAVKGLRQVEVPVTAPVQDVMGQFYRTFRERRRQAPRHIGLPDLTTPLAEYRRDLVAAADAASRHGAQLVLATQPTLYQRDLAPEMEALTWFGWSRTPEYFAAGDLLDAMTRYNAVLLDVCRERGLRCLDLAARLPKDTTVFYDDCHFNEEGARKVAAQFAAHLRAP